MRKLHWSFEEHKLVHVVEFGIWLLGSKSRITDIVCGDQAYNVLTYVDTENFTLCSDYHRVVP